MWLPLTLVPGTTGFLSSSFSRLYLLGVNLVLINLVSKPPCDI